MQKRELILSIIIIALLVLIVPLSIYLVGQRKQIRSRAAFANATLSFSLPEATLAPGETLDLTLALSSQDIKISGVDISFSFDLEIIKINKIVRNASVNFTDEIVNEISPGKARLVLVARKPTTQLPTGSFNIATLSLTAINPGTTELAINAQEIVGFNPLEDGQAEDVQIAVGGTTNTQITVTQNNQQPTATPTTTQEESIPQITFKTSFVGMSQNRPDLTVKLTIINELEALPSTFVYRPIVSSDANRVYRLLVSPLTLYNLAPGLGKTILLKGPKHLAKKVESRIELVAGPNGEFDWSDPALQLEPGDLPNPSQNWQQDGVVNTVDIALLINRIGSRDSIDLQVADLNYDGFVNANDLSLLIETLSKRFDDESY